MKVRKRGEGKFMVSHSFYLIELLFPKCLLLAGQCVEWHRKMQTHNQSRTAESVMEGAQESGWHRGREKGRKAQNKKRFFWVGPWKMRHCGTVASSGTEAGNHYNSPGPWCFRALFFFCEALSEQNHCPSHCSINISSLFFFPPRSACLPGMPSLSRHCEVQALQTTRWLCLQDTHHLISKQFHVLGITGNWPQTKLARKRSMPQRVGRKDGTCPWASSWSSWSSGPHTGLDFAWGSANQDTENGSAHFSPGDAPHWSPAEMNP